MRYTLLLGVLSAPLLAQGQTWFVPDHFPTVQAALNGATSGDTVRVRPGTWVGAIDFLGKNIRLVSVLGHRVTTLDGNGAPTVVKFVSGEGPGAIVEGFTITGGDGTFYDLGGGVSVHNGSSPVIRGNLITGNTGAYGGGVDSRSSSPQIIDNVITANTAAGGGGVCVRSNGAPCATLIAQNRIVGNSAQNPFAGGGGILVDGGSPGSVSATVTGNVIRQNTAEHGGGVRVLSAASTLRDNLVLGNTAVLHGGGVSIWLPGTGGLPQVLVNNCIVRNVAGGNGGGVASNEVANMVIANCTIADNRAPGPSSGRGGGVYWGAAAGTMENCILWGNTAGLGQQAYLGELGAGSQVTVAHSVIEGGTNGVHVYNGQSSLTWGSGMLASDPLFADPAGIDYHLQWGSPCRNAGTNTAPQLGAHDFEGDVRTAEGTVDIGADEFHVHLYVSGDPSPGNVVHVKFVGAPNAQPVALAISAVGLLPAPWPGPFGDWYLALPIIGPFWLPPIPANGILDLQLPIDPAFPVPTVFPAQALVGSSLTNPWVLTIE